MIDRDFDREREMRVAHEHRKNRRYVGAVIGPWLVTGSINPEGEDPYYVLVDDRGRVERLPGHKVAALAEEARRNGWTLAMNPIRVDRKDDTGA